MLVLLYSYVRSWQTTLAAAADVELRVSIGDLKRNNNEHMYIEKEKEREREREIGFKSFRSKLSQLREVRR